MGRRVWVVIPDGVYKTAEGNTYHIIAHTYDIRVLSYKAFLPADKSIGREKHLVEVWTDPGGRRTLSVGSIQLKNPGRVAAGKAGAAALHGLTDDDDV